MAVKIGVWYSRNPSDLIVVRRTGSGSGCEEIDPAGMVYGTVYREHSPSTTGLKCTYIHNISPAAGSALSLESADAISVRSVSWQEHSSAGNEPPTQRTCCTLAIGERAPFPHASRSPRAARPPSARGSLKVMERRPGGSRQRYRQQSPAPGRLQEQQQLLVVHRLPDRTELLAVQPDSGAAYTDVWNAALRASRSRRVVDVAVSDPAAVQPRRTPQYTHRSSSGDRTMRVVYSSDTADSRGDTGGRRMSNAGSELGNWISKYQKSDHHSDRLVRTIVQYEQTTGQRFPGITQDCLADITSTSRISCDPLRLFLCEWDNWKS